jgi:hypothetical protein
MTLMSNDLFMAPRRFRRHEVPTYRCLPSILDSGENVVAFCDVNPGEKGLLCSDAWGVRGMVRLKGETEARGVLEHPACKAVAATLPREPKNHMQEWLDACKGGPGTFQGFVSSADIAEVAMVGMVALRCGKPIEWDNPNMKAKGEPKAHSLIHLAQRKKWLA